MERKVTNKKLRSRSGRGLNALTGGKTPGIAKKGGKDDEPATHTRPENDLAEQLREAIAERSGIEYERLRAISTLSPIPARKTGTRGRRALIDTSALASLKKSELLRLSPGAAVSTLTIAELVRGLHAAVPDFEKERRRRHLRQVEATVEALPFDLACARAYGSVSTAVERSGRRPRSSRAVDLMVAATALAHDLPLCTLNAGDFRGLEDLIEIVDVGV
jgi:predicted nucleic acid-binding protein